MRTAVAWYCLGVGLLMVAWWAVAIRQGALSRPDRSRAELGLHLVGEVVTAAALMVSGVVLLADGGAGLALVGLGMLLYTVIVSPGYFLGRRERAPAWMFAVLTVATLAAIGVLLVG